MRYSLLGLVALNISIMLVYAFGLPEFVENPQHKGPRNKIIKQLNFDEKQVEAYDELIHQHQHQIQDLHRKVVDAKKELYKQLNRPNLGVEEEWLEILGNLHQEIDEVNFRHFEDIRKLCRKDQLDAFRALSGELTRLFGKPPHRKRK